MLLIVLSHVIAVSPWMRLFVDEAIGCHILFLNVVPQIRLKTLVILLSQRRLNSSQLASGCCYFSDPNIFFWSHLPEREK